ncbi:MAG: DNA polymerase IV [Bacteroidota bacterium]|jgi:DNA polymerase-4
MSRQIIHLDLDSFFVSVERLRNSSLVGKPILIGGNSDRGVVASCSYEARKYGVSSAMPMKMARMLCPDAIIVRGDMEVYSQYSNMVTDIIDDAAPLYEKASIDEHYIDVTGMDRFHGTLKWTTELRERIIRETGLPMSLGLSPNKTVSKIATNEAKPSGQLQIEQERVRPFLNPLSINKIPMLGQKSYQLLRNMGVAIIETLSRMPVEMMVRVLGENGRSIWEKANGIDNAPVVPYHERKSISTERTFEKDTSDIVMVNELLVTMVEELCYTMRKQQKLTSCITVKIRYANFDTHTTQMRIPYTASDHVLIARARELFKKLYERRMMIRLVGVRLSHLVQGHPQINLFEDTTQMVNLYQTIDRLKNRFGEDAVVRAVGK